MLLLLLLLLCGGGGGGGGGGDDDDYDDEEWSDATKIQRAFEIGPQESKAVSHLQLRIHSQVVAELKEAVRCRGMRQWLPHDLIAKEIFNLGYSSGASGPFEAWHDQLTNANDNAVVT